MASDQLPFVPLSTLQPSPAIDIWQRHPAAASKIQKAHTAISYTSSTGILQRRPGAARPKLQSAHSHGPCSGTSTEAPKRTAFDIWQRHLAAAAAAAPRPPKLAQAPLCMLEVRTPITLSIGGKCSPTTQGWIRAVGLLLAALPLAKFRGTLWQLRSVFPSAMTNCGPACL